MEVFSDDLGVLQAAVSPRQYACFISYSTKRDYGLVCRLHGFLSGFPDEPAIKKFQVKAKKFCMDGATFRLPRHSPPSEASDDPDLLPEAIRQAIRPHLLESDSLLFLCAGPGLITPGMIWEVREFLAQNKEHSLDRPLWLAVTQGQDPSTAPAQFFGDEPALANLATNIFFDFRGFRPESASWDKVRNFEEEQLRLAAELFDVRDASGRALSADDLSPAWQREKLARLRRTRTLAVGVAALLSILAGLAVWQAFRAEAQRNAANIARQEAVVAADDARRAGAAEKTARELADKNRGIAEKEQRNAEALVVRMQNDIRAALLSLGRMDLIVSINEAVGNYLEETTVGGGGKTALRAIQEYQQGETCLSIDDMKQARVHYQRASKLAEQVGMDADPGWRGRIYAWILLRLAALSKEEPAQKADCEKWLAKAEQIVARQVEEEQAASDTFVLWAAVLVEQAQSLPIDQQEARYQTILARLLKTLKALPETAIESRETLLRAAATTRHRLISTLAHAGKTMPALKLAEENATMLDQLPTFSARWYLETARAYSVAGDLNRQINDWKKAIEDFRHSMSLTDKLVQDEPRNVLAWQMSLHCLQQLKSLAGETKAGQSAITQLDKQIDFTKSQIFHLKPSEGAPVPP